MQTQIKDFISVMMMYCIMCHCSLAAVNLYVFIKSYIHSVIPPMTECNQHNSWLLKVPRWINNLTHCFLQSDLLRTNGEATNKGGSKSNMVKFSRQVLI